jgi:hypothetical protein
MITKEPLFVHADARIPVFSLHEFTTFRLSPCSRRKKKTAGYQKTLTNIGEGLCSIADLLTRNRFKWGEYREFMVHDPKARLVMAAPFMDRVVHHAIHRVIEPTFDKLLSDSVYACREGRGNRFAAQALLRKLRILGPDRYVLKLDVRQYFQSISHQLLLNCFSEILPDTSINLLLESLLRSHPLYANRAFGIPIGNLTSQLFANFYLRPLDQIACEHLGVPYFWLNEKEIRKDRFYIRYMDDLVLVAHKNDKNIVCEAAERLVAKAKTLQLGIPMNKRMHIGADPVPFLGYLLNHDFVRPLSRNQRKHERQMRRSANDETFKPSQLAMKKQAYQAWANLEDRFLKKGSGSSERFSC